MGSVNENREMCEAYRKKAQELVSKMTTEQKAGQTKYNAPAIEELGVKEYNWWNEALHGVARAGVATVFPQAVTMAASFDEDMIEEVADVISTEGRAKYNNQQEYGDADIYKGLTFWSPNVNIFRDPRWGRGHETFGEDPFLTSRLGVRFVEGIQGHDEKYLKAAACAKHFAVHSGPENLRHSFNAVVSKTDLYETYLPAFKACVQEAKVESVMGAYNRTNDEPCCGSKLLLKDILREEWGFEGHVVSDCWAIKDFYENHKVVDGPVEAAALAMNQGCDLNCGVVYNYLVEAVRQGQIDEKQLDQAVTRLFTTRYKLGIMDGQETPYDSIGFAEADSPANRAFNRKVAEKSMVLLKNDGILPMAKGNVKTIGIVGPNADNRRALVGNYEGTASRYVTILEGLEDYLGDDVRILYSEGCHLYKDRTSGLGKPNDRLAEVKGVCANSDVVICCLGLDSGLEGEEGDTGNQYASGDKPDLNLPGLQEELLETVLKSGKPVVLVLLAGSALAINAAEKYANAILYGGYPGAQGGAAIARILFGDANPEGKLPITFYYSTEELPEFTDYSMADRTYRYMENEAMYPFGFGLSYTTFELSDVSLSKEELDPGTDTADGGKSDAGITVTATLTNTGNMDGAQTVQVYVKVDREGTPNAQLKGLKKVWLSRGESKKVSIPLTADAFGLFDDTGKKLLTEGRCLVYVGTCQPDQRSAALTGQKIKPLEVKITKTGYLG